MSNRSEEFCDTCKSPLIWRNAHPYPVLIQTLFGVSFVVFMVLLDKIRAHAGMIWGWCLMQIALGVLLIRGRLRAKKRVLHCIRCDAALPSKAK
ncbi:MAG: hypothetical protein H7222_03275 [Methylotenera sp.]|nr:hypothetical protein [Oligoflexia bacterium]